MIFLKESLAPEHRNAAPTRRGYLRLDVVGGRPIILMLIVSGFLVIAGWAEFETIFGLWANEVLHYGPRQVGFAMTFMAVVSAAIQAGAVGAAARRFSEARVAMAGAMVLVVGYLLLGKADTLTLMLTAIALLGIGSAFFTPAVSSLISKQAGPRDQGIVLGAYQSATALARFAGPAVAGLIYANWGIGAPFQVAALLLLPALVLLGLAKRRVAA
jgi:predicted MFS family arabinose efflux permease